ncbi:MAG: hypothetical protein WCL49_12850 [bacterium]
MMRTGLLFVFLLTLFPGTGETRDVSSVTVDFFFEPGCDSCLKVRNEVLPELERRYSGRYDLQERDIGIKSNYLVLVAYQDALGVKDNEPVSMVVDGREFLAGFPCIQTRLYDAMDRAVVRQLQQDVPAAVAAISSREDPLQRRVKSFTLAAVAAAAVVDSINPCAIATLVFFMSLLSVARISIGRMWLAGAAFLAASFVTYMAIGFGLLGILQFLQANRVMRLILDMVLAGVMLVFAYLSFRDAIRYHRSGQAGDIALKLPAGLQARIHRIMKSGLRKRSLVLGGLGMGAVVTVIESVCTGQVYVPTLVLVLKQGESVLRCAGYLLVYNAIFVLPLVVTLALTCGGMSTPALVEWSRRNVTVSKTLLGVFFLVMTAVLLVVR